MIKKVILTFLLLFAISIYGQVIDKRQKDSLRSESRILFRKIYWNNLPERQSSVNDYERLFSDNEERELKNIIINFEKETSIEIAIVTLDTSVVAYEKFEDLSLHIAKTWGVGKKGKDNGVLIAFSKGYKRIRIQNGNGIEKVLSNQETGDIIEDVFIPEFKKGNYYQGMLNGTIKLMEVLRAKIKNE